MRVIFRAILFLLVSFVTATPCFGGSLSISTRTTLTLSADRIRVDVFAENLGDETAYQVRAHLYIFDRTYSAEAAAQLQARQKRTFQFVVPLPPDKTGEFPFVGEIRYDDVNRRLLSAISAGTFRLGSPGPGLLSGRATDITLKTNKKLHIKIGSKDSTPRDVLVTLYLPPALATPQKKKRIKLKPFETTGVDFEVSHRYGFSDAAYPVFFILTSEDGAGAHAAVVQSVVSVNDDRNWFVRTRWYWLSAGGLIFLGWVWLWVAPWIRCRGSEIKAKG